MLCATACFKAIDSGVLGVRAGWAGVRAGGAIGQCVGRTRTGRIRDGRFHSLLHRQEAQS